MNGMEKHFVTFYSPGTFFPEETTKPIDSWDVEKAKKMAKRIVERYDAHPFGFRFSTRKRSDEELDSKVSDVSPMYYIGCKVETLAEIEARNDPKDRILIDNMRCNKWDRVVTTTKGWKHTTHLDKDDVVLD